MLARFRHFFTKYERYISPATVVTGFIFDSLTLQRIDVFFSNALLTAYLAISAVSIMLLNIREARQSDAARAETFHIALVFMLQFCLGGLFGAAFLFYSKSGTLIGSWPFLLMLLAYVVGNEAMRKNYIRLGFQVSVFFTALFSFLIFFLPVILGSMGDAIFILSGFASLILTGLFVYVLSWFAPERTFRSAPLLILSVGGIFAVMNALYFTNLIPPIPLALKEIGIYRSVAKVAEGAYLVEREKEEGFRLPFSRSVVRVEPGSTLYALSSVFAPTSIKTDVVHVWHYYDPAEEAWVRSSRVELEIVGGRDNGFRTFSTKEGIAPGLWRVSVETPRGQLIGRITFSVENPTGREEIVGEII